MSNKARRILEKWKKRVPKEAAYDDVVSVVESFIGCENIAELGKGSHCLILAGPLLDEAIVYKNNGYSDLIWLSTSAYSIPKSGSGKKVVREIYIKNVLKLISFKEEIDELKKQKQGS